LRNFTVLMEYVTSAARLMPDFEKILSIAKDAVVECDAPGRSPNARRCSC
jgi:hypothetical protein